MKIVGNLVANAKEASKAAARFPLCTPLSPSFHSLYLQPWPAETKQRLLAMASMEKSMKSGDALFTRQATVFIAPIKDAPPLGRQNKRRLLFIVVHFL